MGDTKKKPEQHDVVSKEQYLRAIADLENVKKDQVKLQEQMAKFASLGVVVQMLEVLDILNQAIGVAPEAVREQKEWFAGIEQTRREFEETLAKVGAERIETVEKEFDPAAMEAVGTAPGGTSNRVQSQTRTGWAMYGRVIRPARVIVYQ